MTGPSLLTTALADRYRIERELGSGGMATVYLAHDVRHDRKVAMKVLRPELAAAIGPDRFLAEIKTTAHLQHPHILGLIDSGEVGGSVFYVMPFVQGESLRDRLRRETQLPVADAVRIATQVASALDYAHRHGVIHRDIKPENILLHDEQALVADFGIALAVTRPGDGQRATEAGTSLGTPQYMSPEQAMGERTLDARTDIYSLGCVLYEMLAGEPPFAGPNAQTVIAKVMTVEPEPVTTVRKVVPANVATTTMMALSKLPADRFPSASAFAAALANPQFTGPGVVGTLVPRGSMVVRRSYVWTAAAILGVVFAGVEVARLLRGRSEIRAMIARFEIPVDETMNANQALITPDGSRIVWGAAGAYWERRFDTLGVRRIREGALSGSALRDISHDGREVLLSGRGGVAIAPLDAGPARVLTSVGGGRGGGALGFDRFAYFAVNQSRGIARVPLDSGRIDTLTTLSDSSVVGDILALPGGHGLIASLERNGASSIATFDLTSKAWKTLAPGGPQVRFVEPGYLLFVHGHYIMAGLFDTRKLAFSQAPVPYIEASDTVAMLAASPNVLAYRVGLDAQGGVGIEVRSLNGTARVLPNVPDGMRFSAFASSPDGKRFVAVGTPVQVTSTTPQQVSNLYVYEYASSGPMPRLTSDQRDNYPAWLPGGREIVFVRFNADTPYTSTLMRRTFDGSSAPAPILARGGRGGLLGSSTWFRNGSMALIQLGGIQGGSGQRGRGAAPDGGPQRLGGGRRRGEAPPARAGGRGNGLPALSGDIMVFTPGSSDALRPLVATDSSEASPAVSPDGRLFAYTSNSSGRTEVYVAPMDASARRQVSLNGGSMPKWARSGRELFFRVAGPTPDSDTLYSAQIRSGTDLSVTNVKPLLAGANLASGYAVLPGDSLFIMRAAAANDRRNLPPLVIVMNFAQELKRLFATTRVP